MCRLWQPARSMASSRRRALLVTLCLLLSLHALPAAFASSVSRKLNHDDLLQYIEEIGSLQSIGEDERPVSYSVPRRDDRPNALRPNTTVHRPAGSELIATVKRARSHHISVDEPVNIIHQYSNDNSNYEQSSRHSVPAVSPRVQAPRSSFPHGRSSDVSLEQQPSRHLHPTQVSSRGRHRKRSHRHAQSTRHSVPRSRPRAQDASQRPVPFSRRYRNRFRTAVQHGTRHSQQQPSRQATPARNHQHHHRHHSHRVFDNRQQHSIANDSVRASHHTRSYIQPFPFFQQQASQQQTGRQGQERAHPDPNYHPIPPEYPQYPLRAITLRPPLLHAALPARNITLISGGNRRVSSVSSGEEERRQHVTREEEENDEENYSLLRGSDELRVGKALNIFSRYGFLTLSVKVRPPLGEDNFLFLENTAEVFQKNSYWSKRETRRHRGNYDDHFYIHFCENLNELLIAYFDHFSIEGVPKAHKAFTSSLSVRDLARQFGINSSFLSGPFSFVLVRLFKRRRRSTLKGPLEMDGSLKHALEGLRVGSTESVHQFVDRYGSHVITEFEVGDMMYQTFVFGERLYKELKNKFAIVTSSENHLEELQQYFTPNYATNVGSVLLASGNKELGQILESSGMASPELLLYPNIFRVFENPVMEAALEKLDGEVVLSLKLDKITSKLPRSPETRYMTEVLDNTLALYYQHMSSTRKNN